MKDYITCEMDLATVERMANIVGEHSASYKALQYADNNGGRTKATFLRTAGGEVLVFMGHPLECITTPRGRKMLENFYVTKATK